MPFCCLNLHLSRGSLITDITDVMGDEKVLIVDVVKDKEADDEIVLFSFDDVDGKHDEGSTSNDMLRSVTCSSLNQSIKN